MKRLARSVPRNLVYVLPIVLVTCVCSAKLGGDLKVDGKPFGASSCRNGQVFGFSGVEITGGNGRRIRFVQTPTGEAQVIAFGDGSAVGKDLGVCGTIKVSNQNSTINDVTNVEGKATVKCAADGLSIEGSVTFENCH